MSGFIKREYDYAIRICAYLAGQSAGKAIPISQIANRLFITRPFATKIIYQLKQKRIVQTSQGKIGGVALKIDPRSLSIYDILLAMGFDLALNECLKTPGYCPLDDQCLIHQFFRRQEESLLMAFKEKKINELVITDNQLVRKLKHIHTA